MPKAVRIAPGLKKFVGADEEVEAVEGLYAFDAYPFTIRYDNGIATGYEVVFEVDEDGNVLEDGWVRGTVQYWEEDSLRPGRRYVEEDEWQEEIKFLKKFTLDDFISGDIKYLEEGKDFDLKFP
jgi:hypothetical protein